MRCHQGTPLFPLSTLCLGICVAPGVCLEHKVATQLFLVWLRILDAGALCSLVVPCSHTVQSFCPPLSNTSLKLLHPQQASPVLLSCGQG